MANWWTYTAHEETKHAAETETHDTTYRCFGRTRFHGRLHLCGEDISSAFPV